MTEPDYVRPYIVIDREQAGFLFPDWPSMVEACASAIEEMEGPVVLRFLKPRLRDKGRHRYVFEAVANGKMLAVLWAKDEASIKLFRGESKGQA